jgi:hypothetical protein
MPWVKVDDHFDEHPKMLKVGPIGWALWLAGLAYCNRNLTDGFIPFTAARSLVSWEFLMPHPEGEGRELIYTVGVGTGMHGQDVECSFVIDMLVDAGIWEQVPGGYRIHDYADFQPSKAEVLEERARSAERQQRSRQSRGMSQGKSQRDSQRDITRQSQPRHTGPVPVPVPVPALGSIEPSALGAHDAVFDAMQSVEDLTGRPFGWGQGSPIFDTLAADVRDLGAERVIAEYRAVKAATNGTPIDPAGIVFGAHKRLFPIPDGPRPIKGGKGFNPTSDEAWEAFGGKPDVA